MSRIEHLGGAKIAWKSTNLTEFRGRAHGLRVLEASCHLPVSEQAAAGRHMKAHEGTWGAGLQGCTWCVASSLEKPVYISHAPVGACECGLP